VTWCVRASCELEGEELRGTHGGFTEIARGGCREKRFVGAGTRAGAALPRDAAPSLSKVFVQAFMGGAGAVPQRCQGFGRE
jgi:hypothetical protein